MEEEPSEGADTQRDERRDRQPVKIHRLDERQHQRTDADHQEDAAEVIDAVLAALDALAQKQREHRDADEPDRDVDPEHHRPVHILDEKGADRRPDHGGKPPHGRAEALDARPLGRRVDVADDRDRDQLDRAGADPLERAKQDQHDHRAGKAAQRRADQKDRGPDKEDAFSAVEIGEAAVQRDRHRLGQKLDGKDPAEQVKAAEIADDRRQCGGDDRGFDGRHEDRHQRRREHQAAARHKPGRPHLLNDRLIHAVPRMPSQSRGL